MSSQSVEKEYQFVHIYEFYEDESTSLKNIIIPFSEFGTSKKPKYVYNGKEELPFKERHPLFKQILLNEFNEEISGSSDNF